MKTIKPRNRHACAPILRKGGAHTKAKSSRRQQAKKALRRTLSECSFEIFKLLLKNLTERLHF